MRRQSLSLAAFSLERWRGYSRLRQASLWVLIALGPILVALTFVALGDMERLGGRGWLRIILLADVIYAMVVAALIARAVAGMLAARRRRSAGSTIHMRLTRVFSGIALVPTILVAVFATITLNIGLEGWFSERVRGVVDNSLAAAQAYEAEHRETLEADARLLGGFLNEQKLRYPLLSGGQLREYLTLGQLQMQRALPKAYIIDGDARLQARGERSYLFDFTPPGPEEIARARAGETVIIQDWANNEFRALLDLEEFADRLLYVSREVDGGILALLDETTETVSLYHQLERDRGRLLFEFALIYLGVALIVILGTVWFGLWFAERLSRPIGSLAGAAERVGQGDLDARVEVEDGEDDEIAVLGRAFNDMTREVKAQRDALIAANEETERRRRLFDSVLSGVTAGVIGLGSNGRIEVINAAALDLLELDVGAVGSRLDEAVPEFVPMIADLEGRRSGIAQGQVRLHRRGRDLDLLVRIGTRHSEEALEGYVVSFDDVTELVVAQRMAAWGDVARRIAHEVKNPLTPIQLSAERMRRKFGPMVGEARGSLEQYADVIVRQTNDLRRIVDEFSRFARMPAPERRPLDLGKLIAETVLLQESARPDIRYVLDLPGAAVLAHVDATMIGQALTNLLKNAAEAIEDSRDEEGDPGEIRVRLAADAVHLTIDIEDNGPGLPDKPVRLFEPYVTHRAKGTGLGLSIVKKIVEEHDGTLELRPAPAFRDGARPGAAARIVLPHALPAQAAGTGPEETIQDLRESI